MTRPAKKRWRDVHGLLLLDKPEGLSSNQALQKVRHLYAAAKGGHTGSLDPLATGLLPLCFGEATKIAGLLLGSRKAYETVCRLGIVTDSADAHGAVVETRAVPELDDARIEQALSALRGRVLQVPPVYSALKRDGEPLYRLARRGETVVVEPRPVEVHRFELISREADRLRLHVECGSGTYVRSLVRDLGEALGCGAHVTELRRLWVEPFYSPEMTTLTELEQLAGEGEAALDRRLLPVEAGLQAYPVVVLDESESQRLRQGQPVQRRLEPGTWVAKSAAGQLLAIAEARSDSTLRTLRGFNLG
ncbi:tRNA pseudouridine(55) synthase TruB [Dokdonella immobilis]|uniref:tRNA pseudouridine synthase B n=1 Tax=Dokdonella immobilis TaxID=578942 RepID=A0A1I4VAJ6_9GAMM|nr:tRNA pseudouridine(55) synthase TruB [Dokdonella immobilis]SFM98236.1 tRNA pseudouridine55 synthase [Dokdonella immobilis]